MIALLNAIFAIAALAQAPKPAAGVESAQPLLGITNLHGILVVARDEDVNRAGVTGVKGVAIKGPDFLRQRSFEKLLKRHLGVPVTEPSLVQLQVEIRKYCQAHNHLVVDVFTPEQDILEGTIQIAVIEGKVGKVTVENPGHKWFSDSLIQRNVRLKPGDVVLESRLNNDLSWLNRNTYQSLGSFDVSFLDVRASFTRGDELGGTDVNLLVNDRFPLRPFVGYENTGNEVIGKNRMFAGVNLANAFGLDQRLNYQYTTDIDFDKFRSHGASYVIPLPWRHELTLFGAYAELNPDLSVIDPTLTNITERGTLYQLSGRYSVPLPQLRNFEHEISVGFDFKRTDTPLFFQTGAGPQRQTTNQIDVAQLTLDYRALLRDRLGRTAVFLQGVYSPGNLTEHNNDAAFNEFTAGSDTRYFYGRAEVRRETLLPAGFTWYLRGAGQYADSKLVPTEAFGLGGYATVRGYVERIVTGDYGWLLSNELRTPRINLGLFSKVKTEDLFQILAFCDYGGTIIRHPNYAGGERYGEVLLSVGAGVRYQIGDNLRFRFDYGYQLDREYTSEPSSFVRFESVSRGRGHIGVEFAF